jgi:hypothetical protein
MEGIRIMQVRRRWAPVAEMPAGDRTAVQQDRAAARDRPGPRNPRYVSSGAALDDERTGPRFLPNAAVEGWREKIRRDATMRAVLLNPVDYEPPES